MEPVLTPCTAPQWGWGLVNQPGPAQPCHPSALRSLRDPEGGGDGVGGLGLAGWAGGRRWARTRELPAPLHPQSRAWARARRPGSHVAPSP